MLLRVVFLFFFAGLHAMAADAGAGQGAQGGTAGTNTLIHCTNGVVVMPTSTLFRGGVRVFDPQLYLECDFLTVYYPSNNAGAALRDGGAPNMGSVQFVVARSNVLMMLKGATIIGDDAVYSATNDIIQVTGGIVVIETESGFAYGTNFVFNRQTMEMRSEGPSTLESKPGVSLMEGTNKAPNAPRIPGERPRRNPSPAANPPRTR